MLFYFRTQNTAQDYTKRALFRNDPRTRQMTGLTQCSRATPRRLSPRVSFIHGDVIKIMVPNDYIFTY
jgi:hypothetical protein